MGYAKYDYQVKPFGRDAYYPRANDPTKIIGKAFKDAETASRVWRILWEKYTMNPQARPTMYSNKHGYRPTYGATVMTPEQAEETPGGDNESDIRALGILAEEWAVKATMDNTTNRIKMMLSMLGDVEVITEEENGTNLWRMVAGNKANVFKVKGQTLILIGDGHE